MKNPFAFVIFGATGDLAHNKLIPALFSLYKDKELPETFFIIGFARRPLDDKAFASLFHQFANDPQWEGFTAYLSYHQSDFSDEQGYTTLAKKLDDIAKKLTEPLMHIF